MLMWKPIPGLENLYLVSEEGQIYGFKRRHELKGSIDKDGYRIYDLAGKKYKAGRLVMLAFEGPSDLTVEHIDGDKLNNKRSNLMYLSAEENNSRRFIKTRKYPRGVTKYRKGFLAAIYKDQTRHHIGVFSSPEEAGDAFQDVLLNGLFKIKKYRTKA